MRRVPQGTCGLKSVGMLSAHPTAESGPARDLWIEIFSAFRPRIPRPRRVPQGTCGLKSSAFVKRRSLLPSGPARDLWIEMKTTWESATGRWSGPARDLWIEMRSGTAFRKGIQSGPARDLWIEILPSLTGYHNELVGSRKGPVD